MSNVVGGLVCGLALAGCGEAGTSSQLKQATHSGAGEALSVTEQAAATESHIPTNVVPSGAHNAVQSNVSHAGKYLLENGTPDYAALRAHFGEPNTNLQLNQRAINLADTASRSSVKVLADRLVLTNGTGSWALTKVRGDTLFCGEECGHNAGFVRSIVSIAQESNGDVVVMTGQGSISDVIHVGWVHLEMPVQITAPSEEQPAGQSASRDLRHDPRDLSSLLGDATSLLGSLSSLDIPFSKSGSINLPSPLPSGYSKNWAFGGTCTAGGTANCMSGSLTVTPTFTATLNYDVAIDINLSGPSFNIDMIKATITANPGVTVTGNLNANGAAKWSSGTITLINSSNSISVPLTSASAGFSVNATLSAEADASGSAAMTFNGGATDSLTVGVEYSDGVSPVYNNSFSYNGTMTATGTASARVTGQVKASASVNFLGATANINAEASGGAEASASFNTSLGTSSNTCSATIAGDLFFTLGCTADADVFPANDTITLLGLYTTPALPTLLNQKWNLANYSFTWPTPKFTKTFAANAQDCIPGFCPGQNQAWCKGGCVDTQTDADNCGACGHTCTQESGDPTSTCTNSLCSCTCPDGTACGSTNVSSCN